jgi:hypothetical protein
MVNGIPGKLFGSHTPPIYLLEDGRFSAPDGEVDWTVRKSLASLLKVARAEPKPVTLLRITGPNSSIDDDMDLEFYDVLGITRHGSTRIAGGRVLSYRYGTLLLPKPAAIDKLQMLRKRYAAWCMKAKKEQDKFEAEYEKIRATMTEVNRHNFAKIQKNQS